MLFSSDNKVVFRSVCLLSKRLCRLNLSGIPLNNLPHAETRVRTQRNLIILLMQVSEQIFPVWSDSQPDSVCHCPKSKQQNSQNPELQNLSLSECLKEEMYLRWRRVSLTCQKCQTILSNFKSPYRSVLDTINRDSFYPLQMSLKFNIVYT